jgi:tetratricopeptide (TPR) repeat protein
MTASPNHDRSIAAWIVAGAIFLLVAGIGAAVSYTSDAPETVGDGDAPSPVLSRSESDGEILQRLADYAGSAPTGDHGSAVPDGEMLPDVNTMIERLADRLKTSPKDLDGWRMLGWSYLQTGRYQQAEAAYAKAVELDPNSAELKLAYEDVKAKAAESGNSAESSNIKTASSLPTETRGKSDEPRGDTVAASEATPSAERDAAIRSMVEGLARRLETSPRDIEGWTLLMRSRVVLGEKEDAAAAFRKALDVFKDDADASGKIAAAATALGLKAQ